MKQFAVFGASGFGREVLPIARSMLASTENGSYELVFLDDTPASDELNGHRVLTYAEWLRLPARSLHVSLAIANGAIRQQLAERCNLDGVACFEVRAANVVQLDDVQLGQGPILCPFVTLTSNIRIGKHFHANLGSYVAHDCVIGDYVTLAPGVKCNGNVTIEDHAYIGAGAILRQGKPGEPLVIGRGAVVGMGAVVTKNVAAGATVVGNPAREMVR